MKKPDKTARNRTDSTTGLESSLRDMVESAPLFQNMKDFEGRFIYVNKRYEDWLGIPRAELIGKKMEQLFPDSVDIQNVAAIEKEVLKTGKTIETEAQVHHHEGLGRDWILLKYPVRTASGRISAIGSLAVDISERKKTEAALLQSEELFRHAFDNAPVGMALINLDGKRIRVNQALAGFLGYSVDELVDTPMSVTSGDSHSLDKSLHLRQQVLDGEITSYTNKRTYRHKSGHRIYGEVTASLVRDQNNEPVYFIAHTVDTTENELAKRHLMIARDAALEASQAKTEFQATMSHELRTPLTALHGALGLLRGGFAKAMPDQAVSLLDISIRNSERLITLVNDLLDYEKIVAGKMDFNLVECDLNTLVHKSVDTNQNFATEYATRFVYQQISQRLEIRVEPRRFDQVMSNLLSNAAKFSKDHADILVQAFELSGYANVSIVDTGIGIPQNALDRIFDRFSQIDSTDTRATGGTGLGLAITKALVEGMGGTIGVISTIGKGSTFTISFPLVDLDSVKDPE